MRPQAAVIGGGPAGLMAAETLARAGAAVTVYEAMPSAGRKFLMAGKSGLNLTMDVPPDRLLPPYACSALEPALRACDAAAVRSWAEGLGQSLFTGSTGRVFPTAMKASPLLRAWLARLDALGVTLRTRSRWEGGFDPLRMATPDGAETISPAATIFALGGATWRRLGSDGAWAPEFARLGVPVHAFVPANAALDVRWSGHMAPHLGRPIKNVAWHAGTARSRGEAVLSHRGLEGGGIYTVSTAVREGAALTLDLVPDLSLPDTLTRLSRPRGKSSLSNHLRKTLRLDPLKLALLQEWARPLPADPELLAPLLKALPVAHAGLRPLDEAISSGGGVSFAALDDGLQLRAHPGVYCVGEMLDWEAPTGGYLITACLATGLWAGRAAARQLNLIDADR